MTVITKHVIYISQTRRILVKQVIMISNWKPDKIAFYKIINFVYKWNFSGIYGIKVAFFFLWNISQMLWMVVISRENFFWVICRSTEGDNLILWASFSFVSDLSNVEIYDVEVEIYYSEAHTCVGENPEKLMLKQDSNIVMTSMQIEETSIFGCNHFNFIY